MARHWKPFTEGELTKECLMKVDTIICSEKGLFIQLKMISLSRNTVGRRIEDLSANLKEQVTDKVPTFDFYSIACVDSTNSTDAAQLLIFLKRCGQWFLHFRRAPWYEKPEENNNRKIYFWSRIMCDWKHESLFGQALWHYNGWSASDYWRAE